MPSAVGGICARVDGKPVGMVASSLGTGVSFEPPMILFSAQLGSTTWPRLREQPRLGVTILARGQEAACFQLASRSRARFEGLDITDGKGGALFVSGGAAFFECEVAAEVPAGDHGVVLLKVLRAADDPGVSPLVHHRSALRRLSAVTVAPELTDGYALDDWLFPASAANY
ncbi:flavin reductase family protein [Streptomyces solisilvae]|uniref:flavin reductase family protein n=1 Tax=Streptomyces malaysiensis TaxID=92644 RepID=UPI00368C492D